MSLEVPDWYSFLLLSVAAFRMYRLIAADTILDGPRKKLLKLTGWKPGDDAPKGYREKLGLFITCPWCLGWWVGLAWWGAWQVWHAGTIVATVPFAMNAIVALVEKNLDSD